MWENHSRRLVVGAAAIAAIVAAACRATTEATTSYEASLGGQHERPAVQSGGSGTFTATLRGNNRLEYSMNFTGLTGTVTMAHIHGPATTEANAGILVDLNAPPTGSTAAIQLGGTAGTANGSLDLNLAVTATVSGDSLRRLLNAGLLYVNVHTTAHANGEIRGQILRQ